MALFRATIGLNIRRFGGREFILLNDVKSVDNVQFDRDHCHVEINGNIHKLLTRAIRNNRNRKLIEFEADIKNYYKPRELSMSQTLDKVRQIKIIGKAK